MSKSKTFVAGVLAVWLGFAAQITAGAKGEPQSNWTSADEPCGKYDDMRRPVLGDIGVKIDANEPWADGFRKALSFWNTVLVANFHEETNLGACSIRIMNGGPNILNNGIVARSQFTGRDNFRGKIAVSSGAATAMSSDEMYGAAVHELGHMLGLKHNASSRSVMYFLNVNGTEVLDSTDILDLSWHHKLCAGTWHRPQCVFFLYPRQREVSDRQLAASSPRRLDGTCVMRAAGGREAGEGSAEIEQ